MNCELRIANCELRIANCELQSKNETDVQIMEGYKRYVVSTYNRFPVVLVKGQGCRVWDVEGREYLDLVAGVAVNSLGHSHPCVVNALNAQAHELIHTSNLYYTIPQLELAKRISNASFGGRVFFANSGAEANEAAIKLARRFGKLTGRHEIITMQGSFHGRTMATLTATGQDKVKDGFEPLVPGFKTVEFNNISEVEKAINELTCAVLVEPIQGEGGVNIPADDYLLQLRQVCDRYNLLLMLDEVQTGIGRTGRMFCYQHSAGVMPDVMTLAKGLGGGLPIGAMVVSEKLSDLLPPGSHASTFGATPLVCSAAIAVIDYILEHNICDHAQQMGEFFMSKLQGLSEKYPSAIHGIRGRGLMIGLALKINGAEVVAECLAKGLLIVSTAGNVLRFVPPLIISREEIDRAVGILEDCLSDESDRI